MLRLAMELLNYLEPRVLAARGVFVCLDEVQ
jgi:hypothetical protein